MTQEIELAPNGFSKTAVDLLMEEAQAANRRKMEEYLMNVVYLIRRTTLSTEGKLWQIIRVFDSRKRANYHRRKYEAEGTGQTFLVVNKKDVRNVGTNFVELLFVELLDKGDQS